LGKAQPSPWPTGQIDLPTHPSQEAVRKGSITSGGVAWRNE
jgi:hypothetical protein